MTINIPGNFPRLKKGWIWGGGTAVALIVLFAVVWSIECEKAVAPQQLPRKGQTFLAEHYPGEIPALVMRELDELQITYDVTFRDGTSVKFRRDGEWQKIDSRVRPVPGAVVPQQILSYAAQTFPGMAVTEIEHKRGRYEVELNDRIELVFDDKRFALQDYGD